MTTNKNTNPAEYQTAFDLAREMFSARSELTGIDIGYRRVEGHTTDDLAVRLHVAKKRPESELDACDIFPRHIEGIPVDVIETQHVVQRGPGRKTERHAILTGGMSVGRLNDGAGTLGALVIDNQSGRPGLLSNWHVLVGDTGREGDPILQPGELDGGETDDAVASLSRWILNEDGDAAVALLNGKRAWLPIQYGSKTSVNSARRAQLGETLVKQGRAMEPLTGSMDGEGVFFLPFEVKPGVTETREMRGIVIRPDADAIVADARSRHGDSGALWVAQNDKAAVGMHVAANPDANQIVACEMPRVLEALDVRLATYDDLFSEAERLETLAHDPRGMAFDRYYAPVDFQRPCPDAQIAPWKDKGATFVAALEDPRDQHPMMPVDTMPDGLFADFVLDERTTDEIYLGGTLQRLTEVLKAEGYMLDPLVSPDVALRDLIDTDYPEYVLAGIIETSQHFRDWFDPLPTGDYYKSCKTLGQVCDKLAALHEQP